MTMRPVRVGLAPSPLARPTSAPGAPRSSSGCWRARGNHVSLAA